jgi:hypothetical protein
VDSMDDWSSNNFVDDWCMNDWDTVGELQWLILELKIFSLSSLRLDHWSCMMDNMAWAVACGNWSCNNWGGNVTGINLDDGQNTSEGELKYFLIFFVNLMPFLRIWTWTFQHFWCTLNKYFAQNIKTYQFEHFDWFFWFVQRLWNKHWKFVVELMKFRLPNSSFIVDFFMWTSATLSFITQTLMRHITLGLPFLPTHYFTSLMLENTK